MAVSYFFERNAKGAEDAERPLIEANMAKKDYAGVADISNELGRLLLESGDYKGAMKYYQMGYDASVKADLKPEDHALWEWRWHNAQARIAARQGKKAEAQKHVEAAKAALDKTGADNQKAQAQYWPYLTGYVDEDDLCFLGGFPGPLKDVLGVWCEELDSLFDGESKAVSWRGKEYLAHDFCEVVHLRGAEAQGCYEEDFYKGMPAVTCNTYGQGKAYFVAARMDDDFRSDFYGCLIEELGLRKALEGDLPFGVTAQARTDGEQEVLFVMNFLPYPVQVDLGEGGENMETGEACSGETELPERGLLILRRSGQ
jgi:beta-galactosidase GanA